MDYVEFFDQCVSLGSPRYRINVLRMTRNWLSVPKDSRPHLCRPINLESRKANLLFCSKSKSLEVSEADGESSSLSPSPKAGGDWCPV